MLDPKATKQADGKIRLTWTPDLTCFGYRFYRDGVGVAKGTNPAQSVTTFAKETDGLPHWYGVARALEQVSESVQFPAVVVTPPPSGTMPAHQVVVQPGGHDAPGDTKCFCWVQHVSPTTQSLGGNHPRSIAWAPGDLYKPGDTVWILYHWKPEENDGPGRLLNLHTNQWRGGYEPGGHPDVSAVALDWFGSGHDVEGDPGLRLGIEQHPNHHVPLVPYDTVKAAMAPGHPGFDITLAIELKRPGLIRCWIDSVLKASTVQHPFYDQQTGFWVIAGSYRWDGITSTVKVRQTAERVGHSLAEALADRPVLHNWYGSKNAAGQPNYSRNDLPAYDVSTFRAPVAA